MEAEGLGSRRTACRTGGARSAPLTSVSLLIINSKGAENIQLAVQKPCGVFYSRGVESKCKLTFQAPHLIGLYQLILPHPLP